MSDAVASAFISYVGVAGVVVSMVTGIAGAIMGYIAYRRSEELKALDLRVELKKTENDLRRLVQSLPEKLRHARRSREAVAAATGIGGALQQWLTEFETDFRSADAMVNALPTPTADYFALDHRALEAKLVAIDAALGDARQLLAKYEGALAEDDKQRDHIREDVRVRVAARADNRT